MYCTVLPGWEIHDDQTHLRLIDVTFDNECSRWRTPSLDRLVSQLVTYPFLLKVFASPSQNYPICEILSVLRLLALGDVDTRTGQAT